MHISIAALLLWAALFPGLAFGQAGVIVKKGVPKTIRAKAAIQRQRKQQLDRLSAMSPEDRQRALAQLPAPRRQQLERQLEQYNRMTPGERKRALDQINSLTPAQRQALRGQARRMAELPEDRRLVVRREVGRLRRMSPEERKAHLASDEFKGKFKGEERKLIEDIGETLPDPPPPAPPSQ